MGIAKLQAFMIGFTVLVFSCNRDKKDESGTGTASMGKFTLLGAENTGVNFINTVEDKANFNALTYRNFYNGGGVAIGDINNDGLPDLYFTSNQQSNKLYLNKGNFKFEDITEKAGVGGKMNWSTGVTMADVNGDGLLDIYVCNSGDVNSSRRKNELFINQGNLKFTEEAAQYHLDNDGYSTHAAFFDYDQDGDLDCYILNDRFNDPGRVELYKKIREQPTPGGHKLMRNDGNVFTDVTVEAGIYGSDVAFGLGVSVSDLNGDHLPDIYISNDFWERDYLYINKGNGKFSEELTGRINYCSTSSMGADIADINNDGAPEIFTTDMLPADNYRLKTTMAFDPYHLEDMKYRENYHYQITQNCLHLNNGYGEFAEIGQLAGVDATDWSWGALIFDFENDGKKDIFVSNGILRDLMSMDFLKYLEGQINKNTLTSNYKELIAKMPSKPLQNYAFFNGGNLQFKNVAEGIGLKELSYSNGAAYGDLDNDGDLDLVVNNNNEPCFIYRNDISGNGKNHFLKLKFKGSGKNPFGIGAEVSLWNKSGVQALQNYNTRGFQSSIEPNLLFGIGKETVIDSIQVIWPNGKMQQIKNIKADQTLTLNISDATLNAVNIKTVKQGWYTNITEEAMDKKAVHKENRYNDFNDELLLVRMLSTEGPRLIMGDVNNDKLIDFILPGAAGEEDKLFVQKADGGFQFKTTPAFINDAGFESICGALFDFDKDGDNDLMIASGGNEAGMPHFNFTIRFYNNDGKGNFNPNLNAAPRVIGNFSTMQICDIDGDGDEDVFLGARNVPGNYGLPPRSYLLINNRDSWIDITPPELANAGMVTDACWADTDGDGDKDLILVGDWMPVTIYKNEGGKFETKQTIPNSNGWWNRITSADIDKDGDIDFVLGNWGLNTKFKASPERPLTMFVNDFDRNGKAEGIINWYPPLDSVSYPFATMPEITSQIAILKSQISKYSDYGDKKYDQLFSQELRDKSLRYEANYLQSAILYNNNGNYELQALPIQAQFAPIFSITVNDLDNDGKTDIWLGGNFYALKPQAGRHNASNGIFLKGADNGSFVYVAPERSGIKVRGEVRDAAIIKAKDDKLHLIVARNNDKVLLFERGKK